MTNTLVVAIAAVLAAGSGAGEQNHERPGRDLFGTRKQEGTDGSDQSKGPFRGVITLSDGTTVAGVLTLSTGRTLDFYDTGAKKWLSVSLAELVRMDAVVRSEDFEKEWRWKENGSDVKVYTGRGYPRRWLDHVVELKNGEKFKGHINGAVLHVETSFPSAEDAAASGADSARAPKAPDANEAGRDGATPAATPVVTKRRFILRQYERGPLGKTLDDLVYVKSVVIEAPQKRQKQAVTGGVPDAPTK